MRPHLLLALLSAALARGDAAGRAAEPQLQRVFGTEMKTGAYEHPACITELAGGDF